MHDNIDALQQHLSQEVATRDELEKSTAASEHAIASDAVTQKALLDSVQDAIAGTKADLTAQKALLAGMQDTINGTKKDIQDNIEVMQKLLTQERAKGNSEMEDRIAMLEKAIAELADRAPVMGMLASPDQWQNSLKGILDLQKLTRVEIYRLRIVNTVKGAISISHDQGATWEVLGHVISPADNINEETLPRQWAPAGVIATTTVNVIAIRTGFDASAGKAKGTTFAILPKPFGAGAKGQSPFSLPDAAIQTDIPAGGSIFGDRCPPYLGNPVYVETPAGLKQIPIGYSPKRGDALVIQVLQPKNSPQAFVFENYYGGMVSAVDWEGHTKIIGQVLSPVCGIGRLEENAHTQTGRLNASENGRLDVSVAPAGKLGGFQILLCEQGVMDIDQTRARSLPQCMVVSEFDQHDLSWEGMAPLFFGFLHPKWSENDFKAPDALKQITSRVLVQVRLDNGPWQSLPTFTLDADPRKPLPNWAHTALQHVTHIRILLPVPAS